MRDAKLLVALLAVALLITFIGDYTWAFIAWGIAFLSFAVFYADGIGAGDTIRISYVDKRYNETAAKGEKIIEHAEGVGRHRQGGYVLIEELYVHAKRAGLDVGKAEIEGLLAFYSSIGRLTYTNGIALFGDSPRLGISYLESLKEEKDGCGLDKVEAETKKLTEPLLDGIKSDIRDGNFLVIDEHELYKYRSAISLPRIENVRLMNRILSKEVSFYEHD